MRKCKRGRLCRRVSFRRRRRASALAPIRKTCILSSFSDLWQELHFSLKSIHSASQLLTTKALRHRISLKIHDGIGRIDLGLSTDPDTLNREPGLWRW